MPSPKYVAPAKCVRCGIKLTNPWVTVCPHRRACEARQMLQRGEPVEKAAAHAQGLSWKEDVADA